MTEKRYKLIRPHYHSHFFDSKEERNLSWYEIIDLLNENEQLKQQMQRLYNYFEDWHDDEIDCNYFSEMWDRVKEDKKWD